MDKKELIIYEMPSIAEFISIGWIQTIVAKYVAWKVNRKMARYAGRLIREQFINSFRPSEPKGEEVNVYKGKYKRIG